MTDNRSNSQASASQPSTIGGFRVIRLLGSGGMGKVYEAEGPAGQRIAIKVLPHYFAEDKRALKLFKTEIENLRQVDSSRVAAFIDAGEEMGSPWLATELILGESLRDRVARSGALSAIQLQQFAAELLHALADLHDAGIVHSDIKPDNILLTKDGSLKLIDFGISQAFGQTILNQTGTVAGSPEWMSPEAFDASNLGPAADVFSAGSAIAFAAQGKSPWGNDLTFAIAFARITGAEPNLSGLNGILLDSVRQMLEKDATKRPVARVAAESIGAGISVGQKRSFPKKLIGALVLAGGVLTAFILGAPSFVGDQDTDKPTKIACAEVMHFESAPDNFDFQTVGTAQSGTVLSLECSEETTKFEVELCTVMDIEQFEISQKASVLSETSATGLPLVWDPKTDYLGCRSFLQLDKHGDKKAIGFLRTISAHPIRIEQEKDEFVAVRDGAGGFFRVRFYFPESVEESKFLFAENPPTVELELGWPGEEPAWVLPGQVPTDFFSTTPKGVEAIICWDEDELMNLDESDTAIRYESPLDPDFKLEAPFEDISCGEGLVERSALLPLPAIYAADLDGQCMPYELVFPGRQEDERRFEFCVTLK